MSSRPAITPADRALLLRLSLGAIVLVVLFFFDRSRPFVDAWKPMLLYVSAAGLAFFVLRAIRARSSRPPQER